MPHLGVERASLARRGRQLEYFTIGWNRVEGLVAVLSRAKRGVGTARRDREPQG